MLTDEDERGVLASWALRGQAGNVDGSLRLSLDPRKAIARRVKEESKEATDLWRRLPSPRMRCNAMRCDAMRMLLSILLRRDVRERDNLLL